jgi:hypothetical protein
MQMRVRPGASLESAILSLAPWAPTLPRLSAFAAFLAPSADGLSPIFLTGAVTTRQGNRANAVQARRTKSVGRPSGCGHSCGIMFPETGAETARPVQRDNYNPGTSDNYLRNQV